MPRSTAAWFMSLATSARCWLISIPDALVLIGLNSPAPLLSGFRSRVSLWLGPPSIQRRMQRLAFAFGLAGDSSARAARTFIHPENEAPNTPAADSFRKSRRDFSSSVFENMEALASEFHISSFEFQVWRLGLSFGQA